MNISKRDLFHMSKAQVEAGRREWQRTGQQGRLAQSSFDAEAMAPKTWIYYCNSKMEEISTIECEPYVVGRASDRSEGVLMLHGACPKCGETFLCREDNKTLHLGHTTYGNAPRWLQINWEFHNRNVRQRRWSDEDKIPIVSSPERWWCDYCREWCVKVTDGVAQDHHRGATIISTPFRVPRIGERVGSSIEF